MSIKNTINRGVLDLSRYYLSSSVDTVNDTNFALGGLSSGLYTLWVTDYIGNMGNTTFLLTGPAQVNGTVEVHT